MSKPARPSDYAVRWDPADRGGHVESFFLKANDPAADRALWLKFTIYAPLGGAATVCEVWAILFDGDAGHVAAKETYPIAEMRLGAGGVGITMKDSALTPGHTTGTIHAPDGATVRWDLLYDATRSPLYPLPMDWMYTAPFPKFKTLTPTADTRFSGFIEAGDRRFEVRDWPGMQGHNWGRAHAERYAWAHCNLFTDPGDGGHEGAIFEGFSARIKLGPVTTPFLTLVKLVHRGITYDFTDVTCWLRASSQLDHTAWDFVSVKGRQRLLGSLWTTPEQMVGLTYRNPDGGITHCLNSKIAHCELRLLEGGATRIRLRSEAKAALEVAVKETTHPVKMYV
jgi:hypothetical protein